MLQLRFVAFSMTLLFPRKSKLLTFAAPPALLF